MEENDIIKKIISGDKDAFNVIFEKYKGYSFKISLHVLRNEDDALDNVNASWLKIYAALTGDKFAFQAKFSTWIYKIILNEALLLLKTRKKEYSFQDLEMDADKIAEFKSHIEAIEDKEDREQRLQKIMALLNPRQQQIIHLLLEGYKFSEIAEKLEITCNHLYQLVSRIKKVLKIIP